MSAFRRRILMQNLSKDDGEIVGTLLSRTVIRNTGTLNALANNTVMEFKVEPNTTYTILREAVSETVRIGDYPTRYASTAITLNNFYSTWSASEAIVYTTSADAQWLYFYIGDSVTGIEKGGRTVSEVSEEDEQI